MVDYRVCDYIKSVRSRIEELDKDIKTPYAWLETTSDRPIFDDGRVQTLSCIILPLGQAEVIDKISEQPCQAAKPTISRTDKCSWQDIYWVQALFQA